MMVDPRGIPCKESRGLSAKGLAWRGRDYLFTSESVSEGHPDKVCDRISDEVVDLFFREGAKSGLIP